MKCKYSLLNKAFSKQLESFKRLRTGTNNLISILLRYGNLIDSLQNVHYIGTFVHSKQIIGPSFQWSRHFFDMCNVLEAMRSFNNNYGGIHLTIYSLITILISFLNICLSLKGLPFRFSQVATERNDGLNMAFSHSILTPKQSRNALMASSI